MIAVVVGWIAVVTVDFLRWFGLPICWIAAVTPRLAVADLRTLLLQLIAVVDLPTFTVTLTTFDLFVIVTFCSRYPFG